MVNPNEFEALESDRDYFKHFSRLHETRAKASWKILHRLERLIEQGEFEDALELLREYLDIA
jgi:hypothetical protein